MSKKNIAIQILDFVAFQTHDISYEWHTCKWLLIMLLMKINYEKELRREDYIKKSILISLLILCTRLTQSFI